MGIELLPAITAEKNLQVLEEARAKARAASENQRPAGSRRGRRPAHARDPARPREERLETRAAERRRRCASRRRIDGLVVLKSIWKNGHDGRGAGGRRSPRRASRFSTSSIRRRCACGPTSTRRTSPALAPGRRCVSRSIPIRRGRSPARLEYAVARRHHQLACRTRVRTFVAVFSIEGTDEHLLPDLAAAIDIDRARREGAA